MQTAATVIGPPEASDNRGAAPDRPLDGDLIHLGFRLFIDLAHRHPNKEELPPGQEQLRPDRVKGGDQFVCVDIGL